LYRAAQARGGKTERGIQFQTICAVWVADPKTTKGPDTVRASQRQFHPADHRPSELRLPFGQDRVVPIYLATLAVRQKSQTIRFRTAAEMLETFGMHKAARNIGDWWLPLKGSSVRRFSLEQTH